MPSTLSYRLAKLEEKLSERRHGSGRMFRLVAGEADRDEAYKLALAEGFDPEDDSDDILIMRLITVPPGKPKYSQPPRVL